MSEYRVQFEVFEGPLDLLLYLVKKEEVDIYEVNLTRIASQFIEYIETMRHLDLDIAGEFLVMAATLMYIKSRELLPVEKQAVVEGEEEDENDPRWELIRQLVEYKKFKDAAGRLQELELIQENVYSRLPARLDFEVAPAKPDVSLFDLLNAVSGILKRYNERNETRDLFADRWTVSEKIDLISGVVRQRGRVCFSDLFAAATSRLEVVVTFLALLELIRLKQLTFAQAEPFSEIEITPRADEPLPAPMAQAEESPAATASPRGEPASVPTHSAPTGSDTIS